MTRESFERRDLHNHAVRRAQRAHAWLTTERPDADTALVRHLIRICPDTVRAACEQLTTARKETPK